MAVLLALGSSVLWGTADFSGGLLSRRRSALVVTWGSQVFALLALALVASGQRGWALPGGYLWYGVVAGVCGSIGITAFYTALAKGPMGLVAAVSSTAVLVPVLAGIVRGERPGPVQVAGIVLAIGGVVLASGPELGSGQPVQRATVGLSLLAALGFGGILLSVASATEQNLTMVLVTQRVTNLVIGGALLLVTATAVRLSVRDLPMLAFVGLADMAANATYALATRAGLVSVVSVLASLYPLVTAVLARFLLGERLRRVQQVGAATALAGVLLLAS